MTQDCVQQIIWQECGSLALEVYSLGFDLKKLAREVRKVGYGKRVDSLVAERIEEVVDGNVQ